MDQFENSAKPQGGMSKWVRKNIYRWHKTIGLITIVPVIFWTLSGLMHPFMAHWFKPAIAKEFMVPIPLKPDSLQRPLNEVLANNKLSNFKRMRLVSIQKASYYQIKDSANQWRYFHARTGEELLQGDSLYALQLARYFLADSISKVSSATLLTGFTQEYKYVNRLLPVWKVSFDRADGVDVYVETSSSRLGTFNPSSRKVFLWIFDNFHNWSFVESIASPALRIIVMVSLLTIIMLSALSGIIVYGLFWKKFKKPVPGNSRSVLRRYHRQIGIAVSLVTLSFAFSGAYHALSKWEPNRLPEMVYEPLIPVSALRAAPPQADGKLVNYALVKLDTGYFYQAFYKGSKETPSDPKYFHTTTGEELKNGNMLYAQFLAGKFASMLGAAPGADCCEMGEGMDSLSCLAGAKLLKAEPVYKFENREYGFVFKRLPVVRLAYETDDHKTFYIETSSSRLAACITDAERNEGYSFAIFHKYLLMDWAGKNVRDIVTMLSALGVLVVSILGLILFLKR